MFYPEQRLAVPVANPMTLLHTKTLAEIPSIYAVTYVCDGESIELLLLKVPPAVFQLQPSQSCTVPHGGSVVVQVRRLVRNRRARLLFAAF